MRCARRCPQPPPQQRAAARPVCGADGNTYKSACHLRLAACRAGRAIPVAYKGHCKRESPFTSFHLSLSSLCRRSSTLSLLSTLSHPSPLPALFFPLHPLRLRPYFHRLLQLCFPSPSLPVSLATVCLFLAFSLPLPPPPPRFFFFSSFLTVAACFFTRFFNAAVRNSGREAPQGNRKYRMGNGGEWVPAYSAPLTRSGRDNVAVIVLGEREAEGEAEG